MTDVFIFKMQNLKLVTSISLCVISRCSLSTSGKENLPREILMSREILTFFFFHVSESCSSPILLPHLDVVMLRQKQGSLITLTRASLLENKV